MTRKETLETIIDRYAKIYYYTGQSVATDQQFDVLLAELKSIDPTNIRVTRVGFPVPEDSMYKKVTHRVRSNSLSKADTEADLRRWHERMGGGEVVVELKADGMTLILYYEQGVLTMGVTRGGDDGIGEDVTQNVMKFKNIPKVLPIPFTGGVRGEALVLAADAPLVDPDFGTDNPGNIRNIGNGIVRRSDGTQSEFISFLAFNYEELDSEVMNPATEMWKLQTLSEWGFTTLAHLPCATIDMAVACWREIEERRKANTLLYKIDGVVFKINDVAVQKKKGFTSGRPEAEIVLKFEAPGAETVVTGCILTIGHTGVIKPTACMEPVCIDNTWVKSAQLNNWDIIEAMDIAVGDRVKVIKAKDIIPYITEVVSRPDNRQPIPRPTACPVCGGGVGPKENTDGSDGIDIECKNPDCAGKTLQRIDNWISKNNILGIGETVLVKMSEQLEVKTPADLYRLTREQLADMELDNGVYGDARAKMVYENIQKTRKMSLKQFLGSLSVRYLGRRRVEIIQEKCPGQMDTLADWQSTKLLSLDAGVDNMASTILEDIEKHRPLIDDLLQYIEITAEPKAEAPVVKGQELAGLVFVFTGKILRSDSAGKRFTREMMHQKVLEHGGKVDDKIKVSAVGMQYHLVQADPDSVSNKTQDAKKKNAIILSEAKFWEMIGES